jgi:hypothetical protein
MDESTPRSGRRTHPLGALKFCKKCSREHRSREICKLFLRQRESAAGNTVKRWAA